MTINVLAIIDTIKADQNQHKTTMLPWKYDRRRKLSQQDIQVIKGLVSARVPVSDVAQKYHVTLNAIYYHTNPDRNKAIRQLARKLRASKKDHEKSDRYRYKIFKKIINKA